MTKLFALFFLILSLVGCNAEMVKQFVKAPTIEDIQLKSFSPKDNRISFNVDLHNPNPYAIPVTGLSGSIELNSIYIGKLQASSDKNLAPNATQTITVPLTLDYDAFVKAAKSVMFTMDAHYKLTGHFQTSIAQVPIVKEGELSAKDIISALF